MNIGITLKENAYTPEAYAYKKYLEDKGHNIQLDYILDEKNDINIYFMGLRPFWNKNNSNKCIEIHEYQSLSTPRFAKQKNFIKKIVNKKPSGRIFLNNFVLKEFSFKDHIPCICRDMGVDEIMFQKPNDYPIYDIVYAGSINGRTGLVEVLLNLSKKFKIVVIGNVEPLVGELFLKNGIHLTGRLNRNEISEVYKNCRFGLNYTPDIYPYNIQTSTKTLEYIASGLGVISNKYLWAEDFSKSIDVDFMWLDINNNFTILENNFFSPKIREYSWNNILQKSNFSGFIESAVNK